MHATEILRNPPVTPFLGTVHTLADRGCTLSPLSNGQLNPSTDIVPPGTTVGVTCDDGYETTFDTIECREDGTFDYVVACTRSKISSVDNDNGTTSCILSMFSYETRHKDTEKYKIFVLCLTPLYLHTR